MRRKSEMQKSCKNYRKHILIILSIAMVLVMAIAVVGVSALTTKNATGRVNADGGLNLRKLASTSSDIITTLDDNTTVTIKSVVFKSKTSTKASKKWYKVTAGEDSGYIRADYVDNISYKSVKVKTSKKIKYYAGAGTKMSYKGTFKKGKEVTILLKATPVKSTAGDSTTWYMVKVGKKKYYSCSVYFADVKEKTDEKIEEKEAAKNDDEQAEEKDPTAQKFTVECKNLVYPSETLKEGKSFSLSGKIIASDKITNLDIGITDINENWVIKVTKTPNSKSYDISKVDSSIRFGSLNTGAYKYVAVVTVNGISKEVFSQEFSVESTVKKNLTDKIIQTRINEILSALDVKYFTSDQKACHESGGDTCNVERVLEQNSVVRELLLANKGGKDLKPSLMPQHYGLTGGTLTRGWSCCGFANFAAWYIAAETISDDVTYKAVKVNCEYNNANIQKHARIGDVLRASDQSSSDNTGHSCMIVSIEDDGCVVMDSNWGYTCLVSTHKLKWNQYKLVTISRALNRADS